MSLYFYIANKSKLMLNDTSDLYQKGEQATPYILQHVKQPTNKKD